VIIAEGALAESYIDDANRSLFHNARDYYALYQDAAAAPAHYCAPRLEEGYEVEAARGSTSRRAPVFFALPMVSGSGACAALSITCASVAFPAGRKPPIIPRRCASTFTPMAN
jgi:hypothetical protein